MNLTKYEEMDFCDDCGGTDIGECSIEEWEKMFLKKYGYNYLSEL